MGTTDCVLMKVDPTNPNFHDILRKYDGNILGAYTFEDLSGHNPHLYFAVKMDKRKLSDLRDTYEKSNCGIIAIDSGGWKENEPDLEQVKWAHQTYLRDLADGAFSKQK